MIILITSLLRISIMKGSFLILAAHRLFATKYSRTESAYVLMLGPLLILVLPHTEFWVSCHIQYWMSPRNSWVGGVLAGCGTRYAEPLSLPFPPTWIPAASLPLFYRSLKQKFNGNSYPGQHTGFGVNRGWIRYDLTLYSSQAGYFPLY